MSYRHIERHYPVSPDFSGQEGYKEIGYKEIGHERIHLLQSIGTQG
jgi:hypothetical protein